VVLAGECNDVGALGHGPGEEVDRVGRVAGDDDGVIVAPVHEAPDRLARAFVGGGGGAGLESRAAMDARIPAEQLADCVAHDLERRSRSGVVEVHIPAGLAGHQRHGGVGAHQAQEVAAVDGWLSGGRHRCHPTRGLKAGGRSSPPRGPARRRGLAAGSGR
jgi:hypothetical protein